MKNRIAESFYIIGTAIIILFLFEKIKQLKPENKQY